VKASTGVKIAGAIGLLAAAGYVVYRFLAEEDRPAMIVKNGSIVFENKLRDGETEPLDWEDDGGMWQPKQPKGKKVKHFIADVKGADDKTCTRLESAELVISYSYGSTKEDFRVMISGKKPKVTPKGLLALADKKLSFGVTNQGRISSIGMPQGGMTCTFAGRTAEITINYAYDK
jgi:hypothetical protein